MLRKRNCARSRKWSNRKKQNIWISVEKSKPNEQKRREKLELNERLSAELAKTFAVKTTIV